MLVTSPREEESIKTGGGEPKPALQPRREEPASKPSKVVDKPKSEPAAAADKKKEEKPKPQEDDSKVDLTKDASGLGLTIVGGSDTPLVMNKLMRNVVFNRTLLGWSVHT